MARWLRVPAGTQTNPRSWAAATPATSAWEPSPPAMPSTSAPPGDGPLGKLAQVVARTEHDRFNAAAARLLDQVESFDLAATGSGVHEQHRANRGSHKGARGGAALQRRDVASQPMAGRHCGHGHQRDQEQQLQQPAVGHDQHQRRGQRQDRHHHRDQPARRRSG